MNLSMKTRMLPGRVGRVSMLMALVFAALGCTALVFSSAATAQDLPDPTRFEEAIQRFEQADLAPLTVIPRALQPGQ